MRGPWVWTAWSVVLASVLFWAGVIVLVLQSTGGVAAPISDSLQNSTSTRIMYGALGAVVIVDRSACFRTFRTAVDHFDADAYPARLERIVPFHFQMVWWVARLACWGMTAVMAYMVVAVPESSGSEAHNNVATSMFAFYEIQELLAVSQRFWESWIVADRTRWWRRIAMVLADFVVGFGGMLSFSVAYLVKPPGCGTGSACLAQLEWWVVGFFLIALWFQVLDLRVPAEAEDDDESASEAQPSKRVGPLWDAPTTMSRPKCMQLCAGAKEVLDNNCARTEREKRAFAQAGLPTAGAYQNHNIRFRDIGFAARALCASGHESEVRNAVLRYVKEQDEETGVGPGVLDNLDVKSRERRVLWRRVARCCRRRPRTTALRVDALVPQAQDAIDTNALVVVAAHACFERSKVRLLTNEQLVRVLRYYTAHTADKDSDIVVQPAFSDWQSGWVAREGATFTTNVLVWKALECANELRSDPVYRVNTKGLAESIETTFALRVGNIATLYADTSRGSRAVCLDGNLLAAKWGFGVFAPGSRTAKASYTALKRTTTWQQSAVRWPLSQPQGRWTWIMALQASVAMQFGDADEYDRLAGLLSKACDDYLWPEVFSPSTPVTELRPWRTITFETDYNSLWGAAFVWECAAAGVRRWDAIGSEQKQKQERDSDVA